MAGCVSEGRCRSCRQGRLSRAGAPSEGARRALSEGCSASNWRGGGGGGQAVMGRSPACRPPIAGSAATTGPAPHRPRWHGWPGRPGVSAASTPGLGGRAVQQGARGAGGTRGGRVGGVVDRPWSRLTASRPADPHWAARRLSQQSGGQGRHVHCCCCPARRPLAPPPWGATCPPRRCPKTLNPEPWRCGALLMPAGALPG